MKSAISKKDFGTIKIEDDKVPYINKDSYHIVDTPEEADDYVWQNKPCMSFKDVLICMSYDEVIKCEDLEHELKSFIKEKLKSNENGMD